MTITEGSLFEGPRADHVQSYHHGVQQVAHGGLAVSCARDVDRFNLAENRYAALVESAKTQFSRMAYTREPQPCQRSSMRVNERPRTETNG